MNRRLNVAVLAGGRSAEHDISRLSATSIIDALDRDRYEPLAVLIEPNGDWRLTSHEKLALTGAPAPTTSEAERSSQVLHRNHETRPATVTSPSAALSGIDVIFPVLHGEFGEDGTIQGLLETVDVPYVGPGVLASALGLDKALFKAVLRDAGVPVAPEVVAHARRSDHTAVAQQVAEELSYPVFVKPARQGSSIGISKVNDASELAEALALAFQHDEKVIIEQMIHGIEVEVGVLGNDDPLVSVPGQVCVAEGTDWYDFETKYSGGKVELRIPCGLDDDTIETVRDIALRVYQAIDCEGLARIDCFVTADGDVFVNEINTMPGFTAHSAFPKLFEASGVSYSDLVDRLIQLALDRHRRRG